MAAADPKIGPTSYVQIGLVVMLLGGSWVISREVSAVRETMVRIDTRMESVVEQVRTFQDMIRAAETNWAARISSLEGSVRLNTAKIEELQKVK